jgi:hypothetical protein
MSNDDYHNKYRATTHLGNFNNNKLSTPVVPQWSGGIETDTDNLILYKKPVNNHIANAIGLNTKYVTTNVLEPNNSYRKITSAVVKPRPVGLSGLSEWIVASNAQRADTMLAAEATMRQTEYID